MPRIEKKMKNINDFSASEITFSQLRRNANGGKTVYLNVGSERCELILPAMRVPFGMSSFSDKNTGNVSYTLNMSLDDQAILEKLRSIEDLVLDHVAKNSVEILGKAYTPEVIKTVLFKSFIQESKDGKYAPTLKVKVHTKKPEGFVAKAFDASGQETSMELIQKGQSVKSLVDFNQIWVVDNKFGVSVHLKQCKFSPSTSLDECVLGDDDDADPME
jgi:hypothetical protein